MAQKPLTEEEFLAMFYATNPNHETIIFLSPFLGANKSITCQCIICGRIWETKAGNLYAASEGRKKPPTGCRRCNRIGVRALTQEEFINNVNHNNDYAKYIEITSKYTGVKNNIDYKCTLCNTNYTTPAYNLLYQNAWCHKCKAANTSLMELMVLHALKLKLPNEIILHRDTTTIGYELDIYIPGKNFAIEIGGWKWHKKRVDRDYRKYVLCKENNINLITIYDSYNQSTEPFPNCKLYSVDLGQAKNIGTLKSCINDILSILHIDSIQDDTIWDTIKQEACASFILPGIEYATNYLQKSNHPDKEFIRVLEFTRYDAPSKYLCLKCNKEFSLARNHIANPRKDSAGKTYYRRCPHCKHQDKDTYKKLVHDWFTNHPDATLTDCINALSDQVPLNSIYTANRTFKRKSTLYGNREQILLEWRTNNPTKSRADAIRELREIMSPNTIKRYWKTTYGTRKQLLIEWRTNNPTKSKTDAFRELKGIMSPTTIKRHWKSADPTKQDSV